jgi:hypothetical protein
MLASDKKRAPEPLSLLRRFNGGNEAYDPLFAGNGRSQS